MDRRPVLVSSCGPLPFQHPSSGGTTARIRASDNLITVRNAFGNLESCSGLVFVMKFSVNESRKCDPFPMPGTFQFYESIMSVNK